MKEQFEKMLNELVEVTKASGAFVKEQAPATLKEFLAAGFLENMAQAALELAFSIPCMAACVFAFFKWSQPGVAADPYHYGVEKLLPYENYWWLVGFVVSLVVFAGLWCDATACLVECYKTVKMPRVYLIHTLKGFLSKEHSE